MEANGNHRHLAPRDFAFERSWTEQAAASAGATSDRLIAFAELRAGDGPVRDAAARNFGREVVEELADARNYLVWWAEQVVRSASLDELAGELSEAIGECLAAVSVAYEKAERARALSREVLGAAR